MLCASCGTENRIGSRFCDNCGAALAVACPACGEPNRPDARFCATCGAPLGADAARPVQAAAAAPGVAATAPTATAERRLVSVLFTDLVGFTTYAEDRDPEHVRELLSRYFDTATDVIGRHGGTVEKFIGDAVMAVWGTPIAHEDDAERAVRAALEVVDAIHALSPALQARAGVLTGEAAVTIGARNQGMVAGDLVNTAARLQGVAEPGTVLVGEATMRAASGSIAFEPIGDHSLKGKTAPVPAWQALRVVAARGGQGRTDALEPPFVGREEELRQLKEQLHTVGREQRVRLVSITGPAGIGKSRLVWELEKYIDGVTETIWWHRGRSPSYGEGITFWALGEMVRRRAGLAEDDDEATTRQRIAATLAEHVPDADDRQQIEPALLSLLGVEPAPPGGRDALFPAWRLFFERIAANGTTVLVFEDLQWADSGLLDFIDHLLDWSKALPIMVVTLARPELFDRRPDWAAGRRHLTALALEPLPDEAITELLAGLVPGLPEAAVRAIVARAEGVPLYAVETVRSLLADGRIERTGDAYQPTGDLSQLAAPESLRSLIASRLDGLEPADRSLLQDAAVLGQVFSADALAAITGSSADELDPRLRTFVRRELLEVETDPRSPERGHYKFVQSLIREVAYGTLGRRERRARHLAVARHYEAQGDEELAGALANHYLAARQASDEGLEADAVGAQARLALSAAAERAASLGAHDQAITYLDQALSVTTDARERGSVLMRAAESATVAARVDAEEYAIAAIEAYRELGDVVGALRASALHGRVVIDASEIQRGIGILEAALEEVEGAGAPAVEAEIAAYLSRAYMRHNENERSVAVADQALTIGERLNLDDIVAEALINKGSALGQLGRRREAIALMEAAVRLAEQGSSTPRETRARHNLASQLGEDDPKGAIEQLESTLELARSHGDRGHYTWLVGTLGISRLLAGREWDEQLELSREAFEASTLRSDRGRLRARGGTIQIARGEGVDELVADVEEFFRDSSDPEDLFTVAMSRSGASLVKGDLIEAYRRGMEAADIHTQLEEVGLRAAMRAAIWMRDPVRARAVSERASGLRSTSAVRQAHGARGVAAVAALEGRRAEAVAAFRDARDRMRRLEQWFEFATFAVDAVTVLPDEPEIRAWVDEARPILERLRARPFLERLDASLAEAATPGAQSATLRPTASDTARTGA
jgi:class 3 adenylate cyclase/predicted ATPase